jgi:membrane protein implicated in regulation of membrane protease activity
MHAGEASVVIWWHWLLFGLALLSAEMLTPGGFYLMFFGLAALAVGAVVGLSPEVPAWLQWVLFSGLAIVSLLVFRGPLLARMKATGPKLAEVDSLVGETATPLEDLAPGGMGKAELRGTTWTVRNAGSGGLTKGQRSHVTRVEGLTLWIKAD